MTAEVAVVGLGGSGLVAIEALLGRDVDVVGVEAGEVAGGAAGRNGGFALAGLAQFHHVAVAVLGHDRALACYRATLDELQRMYASTPEAARCVGSLRIAVDDREYADCEAQLAAMRADNLPVERYEGPEGKGLLLSEDGTLQPVARCRILARRATEAGARLFAESPVVSIEPGRVRTSAGVVRCERIVVCVDGSLEQLVPGLRRTVRSARLQMLATEPVPLRVGNRPVYRRFGLDYWQQLDSGQIVLGGCRDRGGDREWTTDATTSSAVQRALDALLHEELDIEAAVTHRWAGVVGFTDTGLPVVRQVGPGVFVAGGYSGTGNVVGALAARALVELALEGSSELAALLDGSGS